ncbi:MAG: type II toxin-antitoxin system RelB/DinJ family antitoxin [Synergistaceae bacterium]|nr:type II toxin-antitoxin system RelB/DinJ family antitoxin [Synergistaceae bacterium]
MGAVNVTVRVDEETKRDFDVFCENVGMNITTAFNMFMRAVLRTRALPFPITDIVQNQTVSIVGKEALKAMQDQSVINGTDKMTMDEINEIITAYRREKFEKRR